jgi:hypothetical protein
MPPHDYPQDIVELILPAEEVSILAAPSGGGKTTLLMQMLQTFNNGEDAFLGHRLDLKTKWGYLANDHAWKMYEETAARAGLDTRHLPHISVMDDESIDLEIFRTEPLKVLEQCLDKLRAEGCTAVVVDTLVSFFGSDVKAYNQNAYALLRIGRYCRKHKLTILGTHHTTKARTDFGFKRPQDRISGSMSLLGFSSTQLCLVPPDETGNATCEFHIIAHNAPAKMIPLVREEHKGTFVQFDAALAGRPLDPESQKVLAALSDVAVEGASVPRSLLVAKLREQVAPTAVDRSLRLLIKEGHVHKAKHGEYRLVQPS